VRNYLKGMAHIRGIRGLDTAIGACARRLELTRYLDTRLAEIYIQRDGVRSAAHVGGLTVGAVTWAGAAAAGYWRARLRRV
jgi:hypothetical protein